jgi:hypothetical protein
MSPALNTSNLLIAGLVIAIVVTGIWGASTSVPAYGAYNPDWDGGSSLRAEANSVGTSPYIATEVSDYEDVTPNQTIAVILSPDRRHDDADVNRIRQFVQDGGTLIVAEDFGSHTNPLLQRLNLSTRVDGRPLRDERNYYRSPDLAVATDIAESNLTNGTERLTLNHGAALQPNGSQVLVQTSPFAYLDTNRNASLDDAESMQRYPVVTVEQLGEGQTIVVSDPSIFINAMVERPGNEQLVRALLSERTTMLLDYSHTGSVPSLVVARLELERSSALQGLVGLALIGALIIVSSRLPTVRAIRKSPSEEVPQPSREAVRQRIARRHPQWDSDRLDRVLEGIMQSEQKRGDDE